MSRFHHPIIPFLTLYAAWFFYEVRGDGSAEAETSQLRKRA
jgi:hypothetical protein